MKPEAVVQRQLEAYNAHDLALFLAQYSEDIRLYRPPAVEPTLVGKAAFGHFYATQRFNRAHLHAEVVNRIIIGNRVIDHERISGVNAEPFEVAIVYEVVNDQIQCTWTFAAE
ncbi:MAG: nuclear transport factor 2 family protein [Chloroflexi bacterium]|nr:nuclear transport factor 2 family protein [Chloroflexota bacterium]